MSQFFRPLLGGYPPNFERIQFSFPENSIILNSHLKEQRVQIIYA